MRLLRFAIVGVANTVITLAVFNLAGVWLGVPPVIANALGWTCGFVNSYILNRAWTFRDRKGLSTRHTLPRFAVASGAALISSSLVIYALEAIVASGALPAGLPRVVQLNAIEVFAMGTALVVNFSVSTLWAFPEHGDEVRRAGRRVVTEARGGAGKQLVATESQPVAVAPLPKEAERGYLGGVDKLRDTLAGIAASAGADLFGVADLSLLEGLPMAPGGEGRALFETYRRAVVLGVRPGKLGPAAGGDAVSAFVQRAAESVRDQLENSGYSCLAIDTEDEVDPIGRFGLISLKAVAKTAGLGWQGRSLLVISPSYGPLHRLAAVLTDAPLPAGAPLRNECGECSECVDACPARALSLVEFEDHPDTREDVLNVPRCLGDEGCMLCIQSCPYGRSAA